MKIRARWPWITAIACMTMGLLLGGALTLWEGASVARTAAHHADAPQSLESRFGLVKPGEDQGKILFAEARRKQPGGPETLRAVEARPYRSLPLARDAQINVTAPIASAGVTDWVAGVRVSPERFRALYAAEERNGPMYDRAHMFDLWLDDTGQVVRMRHHFTP